MIITTELESLTLTLVRTDAKHNKDFFDTILLISKHGLEKMPQLERNKCYGVLKVNIILQFEIQKKIMELKDIL